MKYRYRVTFEGTPSGKPLFVDDKFQQYYMGMWIDARQIDGPGLYVKALIASKSGKILMPPPYELEYSSEGRKGISIYEMCTIESVAQEKANAAKNINELKRMSMLVTMYSKDERTERFFHSLPLVDVEVTDKSGKIVTLDERR